MGQENLDRRAFFIRTGITVGKAVAAVVTVAATADAWRYSSDPPQDPLHQRKEQLYRAKDVLEKQIASSRDARDNAVKREQIIVIQRDLKEVYTDIVREQGPILSRSRPLGLWIGSFVTLYIAARLLERGVDFIRNRPSSPLPHPNF